MPVSGAFTTGPLGAAALGGAAGAGFVPVGSGTGEALAVVGGTGAPAATTCLPCTALRLRTTTRVPPAESSTSARPLPSATTARRSTISIRAASSVVSGMFAGRRAPLRPSPFRGRGDMFGTGADVGGIALSTSREGSRGASRSIAGVDGGVTPLGGATCGASPRARRAASRAASRARRAPFCSRTRRFSGTTSPPTSQRGGQSSVHRSRRRSQAPGSPAAQQARR